MQITHNTLPEAAQAILEQIQLLSNKFDNIQYMAPEPDEDRYVDINEIRKLIFPQWKRQTIYNKCCQGLLPHSRMGARLLFHLKECREWRDQQLQQGKIKALSQADDEAEALFQLYKIQGKI